MCGIVGIVNLSENIKNNVKIINTMNKELIGGVFNENGVFINEHINLGCSKITINNTIDEEQLMSYKLNGNTYTIVFNGKLYNSKELCSELKQNGFEFSFNSDTEILLKGFVHWGFDLLHHLNGVFGFAIWNEFKKELFLARDRFGLKPLYYTEVNGNLIFSSEIKAILKHPDFRTVIDEQGIKELLGLGPAHTPGTSVFKDIYELKPAHFGIYNEYGLHLQRYWKLESKPHVDDFSTTCNKVKELLEDSIQKQLDSDNSICTMLSGGLDSSIITTYAAKYYEKEKLDTLNTFSVDYIDNDKNFVKTDFQPNSDKYYIDIMTKKLRTNHNTIFIDTPELAEYLEASMIARDCPGMADIDSSMLLFSKKISKYSSIALSR